MGQKILVIGYYKKGKQLAALLVCGHTVDLPYNTIQDMSGGKRICAKYHSISSAVYGSKQQETREKT